MTSPEELERQADDLRGYARCADDKAHALATHLDRLATTSGDDGVWKGAYPTQAHGQVTGWQSTLGRAADLLVDDAAAWRRRAHDLDEQASHLRAQQKAQQAAAKKPHEQPSGAR